MNRKQRNIGLLVIVIHQLIRHSAQLSEKSKQHTLQWNSVGLPGCLLRLIIYSMNCGASVCYAMFIVLDSLLFMNTSKLLLTVGAMSSACNLEIPKHYNA